MSNENLAKHQKFEAATINRQQIKNAPYNPRTIDAGNLALLKNNIKRIGLIETIVWNKTTGNLVSGHQRLKILDALEKRQDYDLTVAIVQFSLQEEKEQNIFMNNANAQGDWDRDLMLNMISDIDLGNAGFTDVDLSALGIELDLEKHKKAEVEDIISEFENIKDQNRSIASTERQNNPEKKDWKQIKQEIKDQQKQGSDEKEDYVVISFDNYENKAAFMKRFGLPEDERYIKGEIFSKNIERLS